MKKMLTLLIATSAFVAVHAQTSRDEARRVILGQEKNKGGSSQEGRDIILGGGTNRNDYPTYPNSYPDSRQSQVDRINREYDAKIWSIRNNRTLSQAEKERMIRQLEQDRAKKIRKAHQSDGYRYGKKKGNKGKHSGWEKGKGNPHQYGGKKNRDKHKD